jgi:hypothetical protein
MDDGFGLPDIERSDASVEVEGLDVGFDFLEDVEAHAADANGVDPRPARSSEKDGMTSEDVTEFRSRWADVQASFIDDPHRACEQADNLIDLVLTRLTERFAKERKELVLKWDRGHERTETEELRVAMKGYRALIDRLLTAEL